MTEDQKIENIKDRIRHLIKINLSVMKFTDKQQDTNTIGYAFHMCSHGAHDDLKIVLDEIESGEIYEVQK